MTTHNKSWRRLDVDYPESLRSQLTTFSTKALQRLGAHPGLVSISMMDAALAELRPQINQFKELYLKLDRFRDCCVHRKLDQADLDLEKYEYEEKDVV